MCNADALGISAILSIADCWVLWMFGLQLLKFPLFFMYLAAYVIWLLLWYLMVAVLINGWLLILVYAGEEPGKVISGTISEYLRWGKRDLKHRRVFLVRWNAISMLIIALRADCVLFPYTELISGNSRIWYFATWLSCHCSGEFQMKRIREESSNSADSPVGNLRWSCCGISGNLWLCY